MANADKARMWEYIGAGVSIGFGLMAIAGGIMKIIDLANYYSCSFLQTEDVARRYADGSFEVEGRIDHSEIRGCNLLVQ
jgi:hypothetical protein